MNLRVVFDIVICMCNSVTHPRKSLVVQIKLVTEIYSCTWKASWVDNIVGWESETFSTKYFWVCETDGLCGNKYFICHYSWKQPQVIPKWWARSDWAFSLTPTLDNTFFLPYGADVFIYEIFVIEVISCASQLKTVLIILWKDQCFSWGNILMAR